MQPLNDTARTHLVRADHASPPLPTDHQPCNLHRDVTISLRIAEAVAYRQGRLNGSADEAAAAVLPADYAGTTKPVAERRIVLAGYRIAAVLKAVE